jgi:ATP-binding cassette subfamily C (CFTR/MRP) protein 4
MFFFVATNTGLNMRKALTTLLFKKILRFNQKSLAKASAGKIVTIVSGELQVIESGLILAPYIIISPLITVYAFSLISLEFREGAALGFAVFILIIISQALLAQLTVRWKYKEGFYSDKRIKLVSDAINGIRTIKAYAWEIPYRNIIMKWRRSQLGMLIRNHIINAIGAGVFMNSGFVIAVVIFTYHWGMDREFDYASSLSTIALLSYLSLFSIYFLYSAISAFSTFIAIMIRVGEILLMEEFSSPPGLNDGSLEPGTRVVAKNASVTWGFNIQKSKDKEEFKEDIEDVNLHSINLEIKDGELVTIVGAVGCGKSTMLHSLMHELKITEGSIKTNGTRAYVEQEPFIMSGTLKDNILVGSEFDAQKFEDVCKACCLDHDIDNLPHGAETEIGERGVTISGGQKARLSLARAVYSDADIFFLDDPLSAVDPDVASKLFKNCINGYLKDKCRVLVTHQVQYLKNVDSI